MEHRGGLRNRCSNINNRPDVEGVDNVRVTVGVCFHSRDMLLFNPTPSQRCFIASVMRPRGCQVRLPGTLRFLRTSCVRG